MTTICHSAPEDQYRLLAEISGWVAGLFPLDQPSSQEKILQLGDAVEIIEDGLAPGPSGGGLNNRTFVFDGLRVSALVSPNMDQAAYVYYIKITSPRWTLANGMSVGMPASKLEAIPYSANDGENRYCGEADQCVEFVVEDEKVQSILIQLYIG